MQPVSGHRRARGRIRTQVFRARDAQPSAGGEPSGVNRGEGVNPSEVMGEAGREGLGEFSHSEAHPQNWIWRLK